MWIQRSVKKGYDEIGKRVGEVMEGIDEKSPRKSSNEKQNRE